VIDLLAFDLRTSMRQLLRAPGLVVASVLTLAVAIAAAATVFGLVDAVLLRPLPYAEPERLVRLWESNPEKGWVHETAAPANLLDWRERATTFEDIAGYANFSGAGVTLTGGAEPVRLSVGYATGNLFELLGVQPARGRNFVWQESWDGTEDVAMLSFRLWQQRFGGDPEVIGDKLVLDGKPLTVVGVLPADFRLPDFDPEVWLTTDWRRASVNQLSFRRAHYLSPIARLRVDVDLSRAAEELQALAAQLEREFPQTNRAMGAGLTPLRQWVVGDVRQTLLLLLGAVGAVVIVGCANVAHLLLVRSLRRSHEQQVRRALGATQAGILRLVLLESGLLAGAGMVGAVALAAVAVATLRRFGPATLPRLWEVAVDVRVLVFAGLVALTAAVLAGAAPAMVASMSGGGLLGAPARAGENRSTQGIRRALVAAEVALAALLLSTGGLFVRSLIASLGAETGFESSSILAATVPLPETQYQETSAQIAFFEELVTRLRGLPGVEAVGLTDAVPIQDTTYTTQMSVEGGDRERSELPEISHRIVDAGYFETMRVGHHAGRGFAAAESAPVIILNRTAAERAFGDRDPIGQRIKMAAPDEEGTWYEVVGVVADERQRALTVAAAPQIYEPFRQDPRANMSLVVRTSIAPEGLARALRAEVATLEPGAPVADIATLRAVMVESLGRQRFLTGAVVCFAALAVFLALVGVYGVLSYWVARRQREMGIRQALGAARGDLLRLVLGQGMGTVAIGLLLGIAGALAVARWIESELYATSGRDPATLILASCAILATSLVASAIPARRAARIDPQEALRAD
jgi:putative ABC transport system permease protein